MVLSKYRPILAIILTLIISVPILLSLYCLYSINSYYIYTSNHNSNYATLDINETLQLNAYNSSTKRSINVYTENLHWLSDDPEIATVNKKTGIITGIKNGKTEINLCDSSGYYCDNSGTPVSITVYIGDLSLSTNYFIAPENCFQLSFNRYSKDDYIILNPGESINVNIKSTPNVTFIDQTKWEYSLDYNECDYDIVTLDKNTITAVSPGCTYLYAENKNIIPPLNYNEDSVIYANASLTIYIAGKNLFELQ